MTQVFLAPDPDVDTGADAGTAARLVAARLVAADVADAADSAIPDRNTSGADASDPIEQLIGGVVEVTLARLGLSAVSLCDVDVDGHHSVRVLFGDPSIAACERRCVADVTAGAPLMSPVRRGDTTYLSVPVLTADGPVATLCCCTDGVDAAIEPQLMLIADVLARAETMLVASRGPIAQARARIQNVIEQCEIRPVFQPIYSAVDGALTGVEALSRFPGSLTPDVWFADARSVGLGVELELAAIQAAIEHLKDLPANVRVAFNASPDTIVDPRLRTLLAATKSHRTVIELTEHHAVENYDELVEAISALRALDVSVSIDDVGAGFANFAHILNLRPDIVKIDMSITRDSDVDPTKQRVIESIVLIAREINASVIAEGVETVGELCSLASLGVTHVQGYLLAKPSRPPFEPVAAPLAEIPPSVRRRLSQFEDEQLAQQRFDLAFKHAPIGMAVVGLDGRLQHVNAALAGMLQRGIVELENSCFQEITHPDDLASNLAEFTECLDGERGSYRRARRFMLPDGGVLYADVTIAVLRDAAGNPLSLIAELVEMPAESTTHMTFPDQGCERP